MKYKGMIVIAILLVCFGAGSLITRVTHNNARQSLTFELAYIGIETEAVVTESTMIRRRNISEFRNVITWKHNSRLYYDTPDDYTSAVSRLGESVRIKFHPDDPSRYIILEEQADLYASRWWFLPLLAFLAAGGIFCWRTILCRREES